MKYEVIARRYRPRRFEEVVGQEAIAQTLRAAIVQDRLAHAYLFCGPRGCGKTSMARIFAKALNCERAADRGRPEEEWAQPCCECTTCAAIHSGQDIDVIELDGASHRGIDDMRQIIEGVNRPATRGRYKVYIVDEVHMLTREAFNALLKTLEEPPSHVKFVFATTEAHKIPDTVLSRCQRFDVHPIGDADITRRLGQICAAEGRDASNELLLTIARYSRGGLRDAQTLLDQLMTYSPPDAGPLASEDLDRITGRVSGDELSAIVAAVAERDARGALEGVRRAIGTGADASVLLEQIVERFHARLGELVLAAGADEGEIDRMVGGLQLLIETASRLRASAFPAVAVEVAIVKLSRLEDPRGFRRTLDQLATLERSARATTASGSQPLMSTRSPGEGGPSVGSAPPRRSAPPRSEAVTAIVEAPRAPVEAATRPESPPPSGGGFDGRRLRSLWNQILIELQAKSPEVAPFLETARLAPDATDAEGVATLWIGDDFALRMLKRGGRRLEVCEALVREVTGEPWRLEPTFAANGGPAAEADAVAVPPSRAAPERRSLPSRSAEVRGEPPPAPTETGPLASSAPPPPVEGEIVDKAIRLFNARRV